MDITRNRANQEYIVKNQQDYYIEAIEEVNFKIEGNNFIVEIIKIKDNNLKEWNYFKKIEERVSEFANNLQIKLTKPEK